MTSYLFRMPVSIAGNDSRPSNSTIEPQIYDGTVLFSSFGVPCKIVNGRIQPFGAGDTAAAYYGMLVRAYPGSAAAGTWPSDNGPSVPSNTNVTNVMTRGYMMVTCNAGAPLKNGPVYVRIAGPSGSKVVGGLEAAPDATTPANTVLLPALQWMGPADAAGGCEIRVNV